MMGRGPSKRQMGVGFPAELREKLEAAATAAGHSVAEEIRRRVERTFDDEQIDPRTRLLMFHIGRIAELVKVQTGREWFDHAAAHRILRGVLVKRLARLKPKGEEVFAPGELPDPLLVASEDPDTVATALEAMEFYNRPLTDDERRQVHERDTEFRRVREQSVRGEGPVSSLFRAPKKEKDK